MTVKKGKSDNSAIERLEAWLEQLRAGSKKLPRAPQVPELEPASSGTPAVAAAEEEDGHNVLVLGRSGVGKSTLVNALIEDGFGPLPQGGVGPMTALAVRVRFARTPHFRASYRPLRFLDELQQRLESDSPDLASVRTARLLVTGDANQRHPPSELRQKISAWRRSDTFGETVLPEVRDVLRMLHDGRTAHGLPMDGKRPDFIMALRSHVTGALSPLVAEMELGWNSEFLRHGVRLLDAPGTGIANDHFVHHLEGKVGSVDSILFVVDRSGLDEASLKRLRDDGFLELLVEGCRGERRKPRMIVAISMLDQPVDDLVRGKRHSEVGWPDHLRRVQAEAIRLVRGQLADEFSRVAKPSAEAQASLIGAIPIMPVLAREHQRFHHQDPEEPPRIVVPEDSNIPALRQHLRSPEGLQKQARTYE